MKPNSSASNISPHFTRYPALLLHNEFSSSWLSSRPAHSNPHFTLARPFAVHNSQCYQRTITKRTSYVLFDTVHIVVGILSLSKLSYFNKRQDKTTRGHGRRHYSASKSASPMSKLRWQYLLYSTKNSDRSPVPVRLALKVKHNLW